MCFTQTSANISAKGHYLAEISSFDLHWTVHVSRWVTRGCTWARKLILQGIYHRIMGRPGTCHPTICSFVEFLYLADLAPSVRTHSSTMRAASPVSTSRIWWTAASRLSSATHSRQVRARRLSSSALPLARLNAACVWGLAGWRIVGNINKSSHVRLLNSFRWQTAALGCSSVHPRPLSTSPPSHLPADQRNPSYLRLQDLHCQALPFGRERRNLLAIGKCKYSTLPLFSWKLSHLSKPPPCHVEPLPAAHPIVLFPACFPKCASVRAWVR